MSQNEGTYAAIDFGSNSINLVIYKMSRGGMSLIGKQKATPGILGYIKDGMLSDEGIRIAVGIIADMQKKALGMNARLFCFATASLRGIKNQQAVVDALRDETGLIIDLVSGDREAYYDYIAVEKLMNVKNGLVADIGGGSIELDWIRGGRLYASTSLPTGCLRLRRDYVRGAWPEPAEMEHIEEAVNAYLEGVTWLQGTGCDTLCTVGGTARAVAKLHGEIFSLPMSAGGYGYPAQELDELLDALKDEARREELAARLFPDRRNTITPGFLALRAIVAKTGVMHITLSRYGVREGYLIEKVWGQEEI